MKFKFDEDSNETKCIVGDTTVAEIGTYNHGEQMVRINGTLFTKQDHGHEDQADSFRRTEKWIRDCFLEHLVDSDKDALEKLIWSTDAESEFKVVFHEEKSHDRHELFSGKFIETVQTKYYRIERRRESSKIQA